MSLTVMWRTVCMKPHELSASNFKLQIRWQPQNFISFTIMINEDLGIDNVSCTSQKSFSIIVYYKPSGLINVLSKNIWLLYCSSYSVIGLPHKLAKRNGYQAIA